MHSLPHDDQVANQIELVENMVVLSAQIHLAHHFRSLLTSRFAMLLTLLFFFALPPAPPKVICNVSINFHWVYSRYILDFRNQTWSEPYYIKYLEE